MADREARGRALFAARLAEATAQGWVPLTGDGVRPVGPLRDLPAEDRLALDPGAGGLRVTLVRSPYEGVALHELSALSVLQSTTRRRVSLRDVAEQSTGRREQARLARTTHKLVCEGERHVVRFDAGGPEALGHPELDLESEAVAVALGMPAPACVQLLLDWPRREVRLPEQVEAARTLFRLRQWESVPSAHADVALASWLTPEELVGWEREGRGLVDAVLWRWHGVPDPAGARRWEELGCDPAQTQAVLQTGVPVAEMQPWLEAGHPPLVAALMVRAGADGPGRLPLRAGPRAPGPARSRTDGPPPQ